MEWTLPGSIQRHRLVPWISFDEWDRVYFSAYHGSPKFAIDTIRSWQLRCPLPISVDITAALLETIVDADRLSKAEVRLAIAMIIVRLVNGIADREQNSIYAKSIREIARTLQMPLSFVEIRHAATHNELPSLQLLLDTRQRALNWLHDHYWQQYRSHLQSAPRPFVDLFTALQTAAKSWRKLEQDEFDRKLESVLELIFKQCRISDIVDMFSGNDILLRQPRSGIEPTVANINSAFGLLSSLWSDILSYLAARLPELMSAIVLRLFQTSRNDCKWRQVLAGRWLSYCLPRCSLPQSSVIDLCLRTRSSLTIGAFEEYCSNMSSSRALYSVGDQAMQGSSLLSAFLEPGFGSRLGDLNRIEKFVNEVENDDSVRNRWTPAFTHGRRIPIGLLPDGSMPKFIDNKSFVFGGNVKFLNATNAELNHDTLDDEMLAKRRRTASEPIQSDLITILI